MQVLPPLTLSGASNVVEKTDRDTNLEGSREYRCCQEMLVCIGKYTFIGEFPKCITEHQEYKSLSCKIVLKMAGPLLTTKGGKQYRKGQNSENE